MPSYAETMTLKLKQLTDVVAYLGSLTGDAKDHRHPHGSAGPHPMAPMKMK
jgi:hypothetical protein